MKQRLSYALVCLLGFGLFFAGRWDDEGMWLLTSIDKLPLAEMKPHGLQLTPAQIYSATGPSLKDAVILLGGGTGSFISAEGLVITNHHVAFGGIQALSSVQDDYLKRGFHAKSHEEELPTTYTAQIVKGIRDVTPAVLAAVSDTMTPDQRDRAVRTASQAIEAAARDSSGLTCRVIEMYSGTQYFLYTFEVLSDEKLAFAHALRLPTFTVERMTLLKRLTLIVRNGKVDHVFYPVFPPDKHAEEVIAWLKKNPVAARGLGG